MDEGYGLTAESSLTDIALDSADSLATQIPLARETVRFGSGVEQRSIDGGRT